MKAILEYEGIEANSPRASICEGWKQGLISDGEQWLDMMEKRNLSSDTYDENVAREIYREVKARYADLLEALDQKMNNWLMDIWRRRARSSYEL